MTRPTFIEIYSDMASLVSRRSTCSRLAVGCVITSTDFQRVLAIGYNGNARGFSNTCDSATPGACGDLHAEINACIKCSSTEEKNVFLTHSRCTACAKALVNLGNILRVYYREEYHSPEGLRILQRAGIPTIHMGGK